MSTNSGENVAATLRPILSVNGGVGASQEVVTTPDGAPVPATALRTAAVYWTVPDYMLEYTARFNVRRFIEIFSHGRNAIMYDRRRFQSDTDIRGWNSRRNSVQACFPKYLILIGLVDMPLVRLEDESNYMLQLVALIGHAEEVKKLMGFDACCLDLPYDKNYVICEADCWSRKLDFNLRHRRGPACRLLESRSTELITLSQQDRGSYWASPLDVYGFYKLICAFGVPTPPVFAYCSGLFFNGFETEQGFVARITEAEISMLTFGVFFRAFCIGPVKRSLFRRLFEEYDGQDVLVCVPKAMMNEWFGYITIDWLTVWKLTKLWHLLLWLVCERSTWMLLVCMTGSLTTKTLKICLV